MTEIGSLANTRPTPSINSEDDDTIYAKEWDIILEDCTTKLEPDDLEKARSICSPQEFWSSLQDLESSYTQDSPFGKVLNSLHPTFREYEQTSMLLAQVLDQSLKFPIFWGLLYLVVQLSVETDKLLIDRNYLNQGEARGSNAIAKQLKGISQRLEYFHVLGTPAARSHRMKQTAVEIHSWLVQFIVIAISSFRHGFTGDLKADSWQSVDKHFKQTLQNIDEVSKHLERLNWGASMQSSTEIPGVLHQLVVQEHSTQNEQIKLPFENLPGRRNPHFYGRDDMIHEIDKTFQQSAQQPSLGSITLHGLGGIGKSQTALEYAHRHKHRYDAVFWVKSDTPVAMNQDLSRIACGLRLEGVQEHEDARNKVLLLDWLHGTTAKWLLIFNNAEDVRLVEEACPSAGIGDILVTARAPTVGFQLGSKNIEIKPFSALEGSKLILRLLDRESDADESLSAVELASKLSGHALAISQMAALIRHRMYSIHDFNSTYTKHTKSIHRIHRSARPNDYDLYLDTVWILSFQSLDEAGKKFLGILTFLSPDSIPQELFLAEDGRDNSDVLLPSFCRDDFSLTGVQESLLELALMEKLPSTGQMSLHRLVQTEFGYFINADERQEAFDNSSRLLHRAFPKQVNGRLMLADWANCQIYEQHVLRLAAHFRTRISDLVNLRPNQTFCKLLCNTCWFLSEYGSTTELSNLLDIAFEAFNSCDPSTRDQLDLAHLYNTKGVLFLDDGAFDQAKLNLDKCKEIRCQVLEPDHEELANIYNNLGNLAFSFRNYDEALLWQTKAERIRMQLGDDVKNSKAMSHLNLGRAMWFAGDREDARARLSQAVEIFSSTDSWYMLAHTHLFLGTLSRLESDLMSAKRNYLVAKDLMITTGHAQTHSTTSVIYYKLGRVAYDEKDYQKAIDYSKEALLIVQLNASAKADQARALWGLAYALESHGGHEQEAKDTIKKAKLLRKDIEKDGYNEDDQSETAYDNLVCGNHR